MLNSESIVIIRIKGEYLLYSKVSGRKVYYIANISRGDVYYIVNIPGEGLLCGRFTIRHRNSSKCQSKNRREGKNNSNTKIKNKQTKTKIKQTNKKQPNKKTKTKNRQENTKNKQNTKPSIQSPQLLSYKY